MDKKFYITTAIAYTSRKPHIGNTYDPVLADAIARFKRMQGYDVFFLTGSDEHGQKIEEYAAEEGISPKEFVDRISTVIKGVWDKLNISYDRFIRTTDADHERAIQRVFKKLYDQGDIYKGKYEGKYCVPCESFFTETQLVDGKCPDCGREVVDASEEAYFFRLSKYQDRLMDFYNENPDFFQPESRRAEMINNFLKPGLSDLCVSRTSFKWGIPVDFDPKHVVYVWLDALLNYITGIGYDCGENSDKFRKYWPCDLHVIGKDIVRFHTIYWPIFLMALDLPLPKKVLGHPWVLSGTDKMSKSVGNVIYADTLADIFGVDAVRYYLLSEIPFAQDGSITYESVIAKYNTDLANTIGNLVNRTVAMSAKYFASHIADKGAAEPVDDDLKSAVDKCCKDYAASMENLRNADAAGAITELARRLNKYIDETSPWVLAKDEEKSDRLSTVLFNLLEGIRRLAVIIYPFMPDTAGRIMHQIGIDDPDVFNLSIIDEPFGSAGEFATGAAEPLFARIDGEKLLSELTEKAEKEKAAAKTKNAENKEKPDEKASKSASHQPEEAISPIGIEDFAKVRLRVAEVVACEPVKGAKKLLKLTLDDSKTNNRVIVSGIAKFYSPEELLGRKVIIVDNLKPAVLCGVQSDGMLLASKSDDKITVLFADDHQTGALLG